MGLKRPHRFSGFNPLNHHFIFSRCREGEWYVLVTSWQASLSDHETHRVTCSAEGKFSIFSVRYTVTYQATWKCTSRAGWSSRFRGGDSVHSIKNPPHIYTGLCRLLSYTVCAVKCCFKPTEQPFIRVGAVWAWRICNWGISKTGNTIFRFISLLWCQIPSRSGAMS